MAHIPIEIQKVLELKGACRPDFRCPSSIYAHVSNPVKKDKQDIQYAMLAIFPEHGIMHLGDINPETKMFEYYDSNMRRFTFYTRAENNVINQVSVPSEQLNKLKTLDEILAIDGISIKRELIPK